MYFDIFDFEFYLIRDRLKKFFLQKINKFCLDLIGKKSN